MFTRRQFFSKALLASAAVVSAEMSSSASVDTMSSTDVDLSRVHLDVLAKVNRMFGADKPTLTLLYPVGCKANLDDAVRSFTQATGVAINLVESRVDSINATIMINAARGQHEFDIALPASFGLPDLASAGALMPLGEFARRHEPELFDENQLYRHADSFDNEFYGYQTDGDTYLMFYNKKIMDDPLNQARFKERYNEALALPTTWQSLDRLIQFFHRPEQGQYGGCLFRTPGYLAWEWWSRFHAKGYYPFDDQLKPQIANQAGIDALQELIDVSDFLHPKAASDDLFQNWSRFGEGESFCNIGWGGTQKYLNSDKSSVKGGLYFGPAPGGVVAGELVECPIFNWGWNYVVSSRCPQPELAYLFTLYACSPVISTMAISHPDGFFDPFRREHYNDSHIITTYSEAFLAAHKASIEQCIPDFYLPNQSRYLSVLQENTHLAYRKIVSAEQALSATATQWQYITAQAGKKKMSKAWLELKKKYPLSLRTLLQG